MHRRPRRRRSSEPERQAEYVESLAKHVRLCCLWSMFQTSTFTPFTSGMRLDTTNNLAGSSPQPPPPGDAGGGAKQSTTRCDTTKGHFYKLSNSVQLQQAFAYYSLIVLLLYTYWVSLSIVISLLDLDAFASYRYLDCYLLGRFTLNGRASVGVKYACLAFTLGVLIIRCLTTFGQYDFGAQVMDFLHKDLADIEQCFERHDLTRHKMVKPISDNLKLPVKTSSLKVQTEFRWQALNLAKQDNGNDSSNDNDYEDDDCDLYYKRYDLETSSKLIGQQHGQQQQQFAQSKLSAANLVPVHSDDQFNGAHDCVMFARTDCPTGVYLILRLNRKPSHWLELSSLLRTITCSCFAVLFLWLLAIVFLMTPTLVTIRGFELTYGNCVSYIVNYANKSQARAQEFAFIHSASSRVNEAALLRPARRQDMPVLLPMKDFVSGPYHALRIAIDICTSWAFFLDGIAYLAGFAILQTQTYQDILTNAREIHKRLIRLHLNRKQQLALNEFSYNNQFPLKRNLRGSEMLPIRQSVILDASNQSACRAIFKSRNSSSVSASGVIKNCANGTSSEPNRYGQESNYEVETLLVQALILDHFKILHKYDRFTAFVSIVSTSVWLGLNCTILIWLGITGRRTRLPRELYSLEIIFSLMLVSYLLIVARVSHYNRKFYPLIASLMALDGPCSITKMRWMNIINHYHPRPMFSFTIIANEISFLLVFKMIAWSFSALLICLSFLVINK